MFNFIAVFLREIRDRWVNMPYTENASEQTRRRSIITCARHVFTFALFSTWCQIAFFVLTTFTIHQSFILTLDFKRTFSTNPFHDTLHGIVHRTAFKLEDSKISSRTRLIKAKFHYAIQLATGSRAGLRPARELVRELLASWTKTCVCTSCACRRPNSITLSSSQPGLRPAREHSRSSTLSSSAAVEQLFRASATQVLTAEHIQCLIWKYSYFELCWKAEFVSNSTAVRCADLKQWQTIWDWKHAACNWNEFYAFDYTAEITRACLKLKAHYRWVWLDIKIKIGYLLTAEPC